MRAVALEAEAAGCLELRTQGGPEGWGAWKGKREAAVSKHSAGVVLGWRREGGIRIGRGGLGMEETRRNKDWQGWGVISQQADTRGARLQGGSGQL